MKKKLQSTNGAVVIIVALLIAIAVMLFLILKPVWANSKDKVNQGIDRDHERTAYDSANLRYTADGPFTAVYDYANKAFVDELGSKREFDEITPYGASRANEGKVIMVDVSPDGDIKLYWITRDEYRLIN